MTLGSEQTIQNSSNILTSFGLVIKIGQKVIGTCSSFDVNEAVDLQDVFTFHDNAEVPRGHPLDIVPGNVTNRTIQMNVYELRDSQVLGLFNSTQAAYDMLSSQSAGIKIDEVHTSYPPDGTAASIVTRSFINCWFQSLGVPKKAEGDRRIMVNASIRYQYSKKYA
jgi:hypothetical protein